MRSSNPIVETDESAKLQDNRRGAVRQSSVFEFDRSELKANSVASIARIDDISKTYAFICKN